MANIHRISQRNYSQDVLASLLSSASDEDDTVRDSSHENTVKIVSSNLSSLRPLIPSNPVINRLLLLPAYPTFDRFGPIDREHLLLTNVPYHELTEGQRSRREKQFFHQPFSVVNQSFDMNIRPFFVDMYQYLYVDLAQRFHITDAILDYNYQRLRQCLNIMIQERIRYGLLAQDARGIEELPMAEYALALEFFLQIDDECFFMKTCAFRHAQPSLYHHQGIFSIDPPQAHYGMIPCESITCRFCFPITDIHVHARQNQAVVHFSSGQKYRFVNGYEAILNCPTSCITKNMLYTLICSCGRYDYISYTSMTLAEALTNHREHGNRMMHEFLLGSKNIAHMRRHCPKSIEELAADDMLLYQHSVRCSAAMQMFLDCNPHYWCFVPMLNNEVQEQDLTTSSSPLDSNRYQCRDLEVNSYVNNLPPIPSENYTFSNSQRTKQIQFFKEKYHHRQPNLQLDLYNAAIIALLPDRCSSEMFSQLIESLFITHAQTKLNTLGHLDGMIVENNNSNDTNARMISDRRSDEWCQNLLRRRRRPTTNNSQQRSQILITHRLNPHFQ